jgi:putative DNA primase/helicase
MSADDEIDRVDIGRMVEAAWDGARETWAEDNIRSDRESPLRTPTNEERISGLARLSPLDYDACRNEAAAELQCRVATLDAEVAKRRARRQDSSATAGQGRALALAPPEPWPEPVAGAALLGEIEACLQRHLTLPEGAATPVALWIVHTHAFDASPITPRLAITSAEKRCGKSTLLRVIGALVSKPLTASNITAAAIFRTVEACQPTLLIDEADTFLPESEELRGILNSGHARDGNVIRLVGDDHEPRQFSTWAAAAVAAIGELPGTIADRSIMIRMERQRPADRKAPLRLDRLDAFKPLARRIARWAADNRTALAEADPALPDPLNDRAADNWRPLVALADAAGGPWPEAARRAALTISGADNAPRSNRERLLGDIRAVYLARGVDRLSSADLCLALAAMDDRPWPEWRQGKPITQRQLASLLAPFAVSPGTIRVEGATAKGYVLDQFADAFARYLPEEVPLDPSHRHNPQETAKNRDSESVTVDPAVTDRIFEKSTESAACDGVTDRDGETGPGIEWEPF